MIETIILGIVILALGGLFLRFTKDQQSKLQELFNKQFKEMGDQQKELVEMLMAGSYQEWLRIKQGKKPEANDVKNEENLLDLTEDNRISFEEITGVKVNDGPKKEIRINR